MTSKKRNVTVIAIIIVIMMIAIAVTMWFIAVKSIATESALVAQTQSALPSTQADTSSDWKTYKSNLGFSFEYPKNWSCHAIKEDLNVIGAGVACTDATRKAEFDNEPNKLGGAAYFKNDLDIYFSGYETIDEYLSKDPTTEKIGSLVLGERTAYDIIIGGYGAYYGIMTEFDNRVLVLSFLPDSQSKIGDIEKHIIASFKFTK